MKKILSTATLIMFLYFVALPQKTFGNCETGYACSLKDLNEKTQKMERKIPTKPVNPFKIQDNPTKIKTKTNLEKTELSPFFELSSSLQKLH